MAVSISMTASQRRFVYGANVALAVALALAATVLVVWLAQRYGGRYDLTRSGVNSLSPQTIHTLRSLADTNTEVTVTAFYTDVLKDLDKFAEKRRSYMADLLSLMETYSRGKLAQRIIDRRKEPDATRQIVDRLRKKPAFKDEYAAQEEVLNGVPEVAQALATLMDAEVKQIENLSRLNEQAGKIRQITLISTVCNELLAKAREVDASLQELRRSETPRLGPAVQAIQDFLELTRKQLNEFTRFMTGDGLTLPGLSPEFVQFFRTSGERYATVLPRIEALLTRLAGVSFTNMKLETLLDKLSADRSVLVETAESAIAIPSSEIWVVREGREVAADGDNFEFLGEDALYSAIRQLTQKRRIGVIFVRAGGEPLLRPDFSKFNPAAGVLPTAAYQRMGMALEKESFITAEWDVATQPEPPAVEGAEKRVLIIIPPSSDRPNMFQQAPGLDPRQKETILAAAAEADGAVFVGGWSIPGTPPFPFADYLREQWGIEVKSDFFAVAYRPNAEEPNTFWPAGGDPSLLTTDSARFTDHPICRSLQASFGALIFACPVQALSTAAASQAASAPAARVQPLIEVPTGVDVWASANFMRAFNERLMKRKGVSPQPEDLLPPFSLAVAAERDGKRIVVFGSQQMFDDKTAHMTTVVQDSLNLVATPVFPANVPLLVNSIYWSAGLPELIPQGVKRGEVPRLSRLRSDAVVFWQAVTIGTGPVLTLIAGVVVWMLRRR